MKKTNVWFLIATCFGIGRIKFAPGTWGSLFAVLFFLVTSDYIVLTMILILPLTILGIYATNKYMEIINFDSPTNKDPQDVVIDEFVGQTIAIIITLILANYILAAPIDDVKIKFIFGQDAYSGFNVVTFSAVIAFVLFRFFDILKPFPIGWLDNNIEGGKGVMLDDVAAGIIAGLTSTLVFLAL